MVVVRGICGMVYPWSDAFLYIVLRDFTSSSFVAPVHPHCEGVTRSHYVKQFFSLWARMFCRWSLRILGTRYWKNERVKVMRKEEVDLALMDRSNSQWQERCFRMLSTQSPHSGFGTTLNLVTLSFVGSRFWNSLIWYFVARSEVVGGWNSYKGWDLVGLGLIVGAAKKVPCREV